MTGLFISYSRKDLDIAKKLTQAFTGQNLDYWIDWEGIPPTVDWWKEIEKGIEEADVFIMLLSPDSIQSRVCQQEIEHAAKNGKRLIPLVIREIKVDEVSPEFRPLNWIFFRENDDFNISFDKLITAIQTDYTWVKTHRQLQLKALEWKRNNCENGFLLHEKELQDAEIQLAANSSKEPHPTDLQREYVLSSRQETDKSRRRIIIGLVGFSTLVLGFLIFSLIQLNISRAQQLGFQSQVAFAENDYTTAALLAYQSNQMSNNDAADLTLGRIYYENFAVGETLIHDAGKSITAELSSNGKLALASDTTEIVVWNLPSKDSTQLLTTTGEQNAGLIIANLAWSPDGQLASIAFNGRITIWDIDTGIPTQTFEGGEQILAWSSDGELASDSDSDNSVIIWNFGTSAPARILNGHEDRIVDITWSTGGRLASASADGKVIIWDTESGRAIQTLDGSRIAWSYDDRLASVVNNGTIIIWDIKAGKKIQSLKYEDHTLAGIDDLEWSDDGKLAASSYNTLLIWDLKTELPIQTLKGHTNAISSYKWSTDDGLITYSADGSVIFWEINPSRPAQTINTDKPLSVATSTEGQMASASGKNILIWNPGIKEPIMVLEGHTDIVNSIAWSNDGRLASGSDDQTVVIWDLDKGIPLQILKGHPRSVNNVDWSINGELASSSYFDNSVIIWDLATAKPAREFGTRVHDKGMVWLGEKRLATAWANKITIWDTNTGIRTQILESNKPIDSISWSEDGRLASTSDITVIVWDLEKAIPAKTLNGHDWHVTDLAWSTDGYLASASAGTVIIWDIAKAKPAHILKPHTITDFQGINSIAWLSDGRLVSSSVDNTIKIARGDLLRVEPCEWIARNMTIREWAAYQGGFFIYRPACPNLPHPTFNTLLSDDPGAIGYTWPGRVLITGIIILFLTTLFLIIRVTIRKVLQALGNRRATYALK